jgi:hypothetical protein
MSTTASDKKIDLFIVGTQKGGTTFLHEYFRDNTTAQMSAKKEIPSLAKHDIPTKYTNQ